MSTEHIEDIYGLSPMQEGMLFHSLLDPEANIYLIRFACRIQGHLDLNAFQRAWQEVIARHPVLRSAFLWQEVKTPLQVVLKQVELPWQHHDWRELPAPEREQQLEAWLDNQHLPPIDLAQAPLMRFVSLQTAEREYVFIWQYHHLLLDGWSLAIVLREVFLLYGGITQQQRISLERVRPYRDYIAWQRQQSLAEAETFWRAQLAGFTSRTPLALPHPQPDPAVAHGPTAQVRRQLTAAQTSDLLALARKHQLTLSTIVQGAWALLLSRYSGESDVVFGVTVSGRPADLRDAEHMVGLFINTLPLRVRCAPQMPAGAWLRELQTQMAELRQYEYSPLAQVQTWSELPPNEALFESLLVFENYPIQGVGSAPSAPFSVEPLQQIEQTNYPLTVIAEPGQHLTIRVIYDRARFAPDAIERLLGHLETCLGSISANTDAPLARLPLLTAAERRQLLQTWNPLERPPEQPLVHEQIAEHARVRPTALAVAGPDRQLSYQELDRQANQLAHYLRALGAGPEARVGVCLERSADLIVAQLGAVKAGAAYMPISPAEPADRLRWLIQDAQLDVLISSRTLLEQLPVGAPHCLATEAWDSELSRLPDHLPPNRAGPDNLAYIIYTSGSTGTPKGVGVSHRNLLNLVAWHRDTYQLGLDDRASQLASISFDAAVWEIWPVLASGASLHLPDSDTRTDPDRLSQWLRQERISIGFAPTPLAEALLLQDWPADTALRALLTGGDQLRQLPPADLPFKLINHYGPTEVTVVSTAAAVEATMADLPPIGRPISGLQTYVLDAAMNLVPVGVIGELYVGGAGVARGYVGRPDLTAERFVPNPFWDEGRTTNDEFGVGVSLPSSFKNGETGDVSGAGAEEALPSSFVVRPSSGRLYRTGDLVRYRADGQLDFVGRTDQQVKLRGFRIELGEIEAHLLQHPAVRQAAVALREDVPGNRRLVAYVVSASDGASGAEPLAQAEELREVLRQRLPEYMVPSAFVLLEALPLTAHDKVDRRRLPAPADSGALDPVRPAAPQTPEEELLVDLWQQVLKVAPVGIHDNFFERGGHSLLATQLLARIREVFEVDLPLRSLFEHPTVAAQVEHIQRMRLQSPVAVPELVPVARDVPPPLSFAQQRLWLLDQLEPDSPAYNIPAGVYLDGELDIAALTDSLSAVVARHETLRTTFAVQGGQAVQVIHPAEPFPLPQLDLGALPPAEREARIQQLIGQEARAPFQLDRGPLLRARLLRLEPRSHVLLLTIHHIIADAWSVEILVRELAGLYAAFRRGQPAALEPLPLQYADFAVWQRGWLQGQVLEEQLDYWRGQLAGAAPLLALPTDHTRPAVQQYRGAICTVALPDPLARGLVQFSRRNGCTLFMAMLTGFQTLLARYTGQADIVVGSDVANRNQLGVQNLIGFFVNTLVLRTDLAGNPSFREALQRVRRTCLDAYAHQDVPFERVVQALQPNRDLSYHPLFQVMFAVQHASHEQTTLDGLTLRPLEMNTGTAKFDLTVVVVEADQRMQVQFEYSTDLFEPATIQRMIHHYLQVLGAMVGDLDQAIEHVPLLSAAERQQVLADWNASQADAPLASCFQEIFEEQVARAPERIAAHHLDRALTYRELNQQANRLARALRAYGAGPDTLVAILAERSLEFLTGVLAVFKAGAAYLPLDPHHPVQRHRQVLEQSAAPLVLATAEWLPTLEEARAGLPEQLRPQIVRFDDLLAQEHADTNLPRYQSPQHLAYTIFTSGSTGTPKGAMVEQRGMVNHLYAKVFDLQLHAGDVIAQTASQCFDISVWQMLVALVLGGQVHIITTDTAHNPARLLDYTAQHRITVLEVVPSLMRAMLEDIAARSAKPDLAALRWLVPTGEALPPELCRQWLQLYPQIPLTNAYGPTECSDDVTHYVIRSAPAAEQARVPIGYPVANMRLYILDRHLEPVPPGVSGELYVGGVGVGRGYLHNSRLTAETFRPDPFSQQPGMRLYKTGDLARHLPDGSIDFLGRIDHQVKIRGFRIELGEIESVLAQHADLQEALVVAREDEAGQPRLVAYVVPDRQLGATPEQTAQQDVAQVDQWQSIFDEIYSQQVVSQDDAGINLRVWINSYTGRPFDEAEIVECVDDTIARLRALRPARVLEIGCGTGLLLFRLASGCEQYYASDVSSEVLRQVERQLPASGLTNVHLYHRAAHDMSGLPQGSFDLVIINEVVQYFPGVEYLVRVLEQALPMVRPGGRVFIGDVRNYQLLEAFHLSVQLEQAPDSMPYDQLRQRIQRQRAQEKELLVAPDFFRALQRHLPAISAVSVQMKGGRHHNEFTRFRYDTLLQIGQAPAAAPPQHELRWQEQPWTAAQLEQWLRDTAAESVAIDEIANPRLLTEQLAAGLLNDSDRFATVGELRQALEEARQQAAGIDPQALLNIGHDLSYAVSLHWSGHSPWRYTARLHRRAADQPRDQWYPLAAADAALPAAWQSYANTPVGSLSQETLVPRLRTFLSDRLPGYMVPAIFVVLDALPLTSNGKIDHHALPVPAVRLESQLESVAPRTPIEERLAEIWREVLHIDRIGVNDNFFELGGHSLLGTQVVNRVYDMFQVELPLRHIFDTPTIADLAAYIAKEKLSQAPADELEQLLRQLEGLSDEDAQRLLDQYDVEKLLEEA
jgi:amino acid adenylation domain-containing protein